MNKKEIAQSLRRQGISHTDIAKQLEVADSTLHRWIKNIPVEYTRAIALKNNKRKNLHRGNKKQSEAFRAARLTYRANGVSLFQKNKDFRDLVLLYWCEGTKNGENFGFCNTDPYLLKIVYDHVKKLGFGDKIVFDLTYHNDKTTDDVKLYWESIMGEPLIFKSVMIKQAGVSKRKNRHYGGMLSLIVRRVELAQMMMGAIQHIKDSGLTSLAG